MRISDWSSDVCSSDLDQFDAVAGLPVVLRPHRFVIAGPRIVTTGVGVDEALHRIGAGAEVADRGVPDAHEAPVAGVADIDNADVALDLAATAVDLRPVGMDDPDFALADDLFDHRAIAQWPTARFGIAHPRPFPGFLAGV